MWKILFTASVLALIGFLFNGCINQPSSPQSTNHTGTITELKPAVAVPPQCHLTPVYLVQSAQGLEGLPWMKAEPPSSGIVAYLFFADQGSSNKNQTYRPLHTGGSYPNGNSTKILWVIDSPYAANTIEIIGKKLSDDQETFRQIFPMALSPADNYPSIVNVPTSGCWQLQLKSGTITGTVTFWVVGD